MRRFGLTACALLLLLAMIAPAGGHRLAVAQSAAWVTLSPMLTPRTSFAAALGKDGRIYVFGGTNGFRSLNDAEVFDLSTFSWSPIAPLPTPRSSMGAATAPDGRIFVIGGWTESASLNTVEAYDPSTKTWACSSQAPGCASTSLAPMPSSRSALAVTTGGDGRIYAIGGFTDAPVATVEIYDPATNAWQTGPSLPHPAAAVGATTEANGDILAAGGFDGQSDLNGDETLCDGTGQDQQWHAVTNQPGARRYEGVAASPSTGNGSAGSDCSGASADQRSPGGGDPVYLIGGESAHAAVTDVDIYQPGAGTWTAGLPLPTPRDHAAAVAGKDGTIYVLGGDRGDGSGPSTSVVAYSLTGSGIPTATETPTAISTSAPPPTPKPGGKKRCAKGQHLTHGKCQCQKGSKLVHGKCQKVKSNRKAT